MKYCWYCGTELRRMLQTQDHQIPKSRGGKDDKANLVDCCRNCNHEKGSMTVEEYRIFVWLQKLHSPLFTHEQIGWLNKMRFSIEPHETVPLKELLKWDGKFHGERK